MFEATVFANVLTNQGT